MAVRRMFSRSIMTSDVFLRLPAPTKTLYLFLNLYADDDGFVDNSQTIMRLTRTAACDLSRLEEAGYLIPFDNGVVAVTHWRVHNLIRKDRYTPTRYPELLASLTLTNGVYFLTPAPATE